MLYAIIFIFCMALSNIILHKKIIKIPFIICIACAMLIVVHLGCRFFVFQDKIEERTLEAVSKLSWNNEEQLYDLGFEKNDENLSFDSEGIWGGKNNLVSFFSIYVEKAEQSMVEETYKMKNRNNMLYSYEVVCGYDNIFTEFINVPQTVSRYYYFYKDGYLISVREHNEEDTNKLFEQYIANLNEKIE